MFNQNKNLASEMTPYEFSLYIKNLKDRVLYFDKYRTEQRRNAPVMQTKTVKRSMQRRGLRLT